MGHRQLEVVRGELQLAIAGREQDVAQDGQRAFGRHDPADDGKAFGEVLLQALELHRGVGPFLGPTWYLPKGSTQQSPFFQMGRRILLPPESSATLFLRQWSP